jgi:ketosteroid isomerase-like protein
MVGELPIGAVPGPDEVGEPADGEPAPLDGPDWHKFHRGYEAVNRGDLGGVLAFLHPEIEWDMSRAFPDGPVYHGHAGVRRFFDDAAKLWDDFRLEIDELHELDEHVVVVGWWTGTGRHSRVPIRSPGAWVYRMRHGRADRMRFYRDRAAGLRSV